MVSAYCKLGLYCLSVFADRVIYLLSLLLYKNQTLENADKKWVKTLIEGSEGKSVMKAIAFYKDIENFKQNN